MIGAVDIGGTKIAVGMVSEQGQVLARTECPTEPERGWPDGLARIISMLEEAADQAAGDAEADDTEDLAPAAETGAEQD